MPYGDDPHRGERPGPRDDVQSRSGDATGPRQQNREDGRDRRDGEAAPRSPRMWIILGLVALVAAIGGGWHWYATRDQESTDDAYTDGRAVVVAAKVAGYVTELNVTDNQPVRAGQVLLRIDPRDYLAARDQAQGRLDSARAQRDNARVALELARIVYPARLASAQAQRTAAQAVLTRARADLRRQQGLPRAATTQTALDESTAGAAQAEAQLAQAEAAVRQAEPVAQNIAQAEAQLRELEGQVAQAEAQLRQAEVNLSYCTLVAPQDGTVTKRNVERGNFVNAGASLMSLVSPELWVTANFKESQLDRMRPGQKVRISVDAYPGLDLRGHVDSLQMGSGGRFSAFPPENATGNFVKIVQRVPVKIVIDAGVDPNRPLPLGLSVVPTVALR
ncbi:HlyD family secretion protein [Rhodovastum atsumiense]|uniref:HlyD family secretion protein n=1 Tax=Rhodovastum atsumiense TaxID=504468 RepID=A0A5M6IZ03_9PROT|nr:HlyD family secretion protein [Rhodovastum atsumiense]KAA5613057.1 HlyD family secretion protein [Rhodovastum atsumiense]CAH2600082.1 HlyD family secretion protein [Rhodovastum atsumiense]